MTVGPSEAHDWRQIDPGLSLESHELAELLRFWESLRGGRDLPGRQDFEPADILPHLGWIILLDVEVSPPRYRFRLVGSGITNLLSRDSTGRYLDELYGPEIYETSIRPYAFVTAERRPVRSVGRMVHANKDYIGYEAIYLPFSGDGGTVDLIMERVVYDTAMSAASGDETGPFAL